MSALLDVVEHGVGVSVLSSLAGNGTVKSSSGSRTIDASKRDVWGTDGDIGDSPFRMLRKGCKSSFG